MVHGKLRIFLTVRLRFGFKMVPQPDPLKFPLWLYLKQPVFNRDCRLILSPKAFWCKHRLDYLEKCWIQEYKPEEHYNS